MSGMLSGAAKIGNNRPPRVHIEYKVDRGNGVFEPRSLPLVMAVMGDFSGANKDPKKLRDRELTDISASTFNQTMSAIKPRVNFTVPSKLPGVEGDLKVDVTFNSMKDFTPEALARKIDGMKELMDLRDKLKNFLTYIDSDPKTEEFLKKVLKDENLLKSLTSAPKKPEGQ